jgi:inorganic pyrophosphatase
MPSGTKYKYEADKSGGFVIDRVLRTPVPFNYGYIPNTHAPDGDPLDIFIISDEPIAIGTKVRCSVLGVLAAEDQGVRDDKIIAVLTEHEAEDLIKYIKRINKIKTYLKNYKEGFVVSDFGGSVAARRTIDLCREAYEGDY